MSTEKSVLICCVVFMVTILAGVYVMDLLDHTIAAERNVALHNIVTVSNYTYVPVHFTGSGVERAKMTIAMLVQFETSHPELEITGWKTDAEPGSGDTTYGIYIDHRPKEK